MAYAIERSPQPQLADTADLRTPLIGKTIELLRKGPHEVFNRSKLLIDRMVERHRGRLELREIDGELRRDATIKPTSSRPIVDRIGLIGENNF